MSESIPISIPLVYLVHQEGKWGRGELVAQSPDCSSLQFVPDNNEPFTCPVMGPN